MTSLVGLLQVMQADMPRVKAEQKKRKNLAHHKMGLNRSHNEDAGWMPPQWIVPSAGTRCGTMAMLQDEINPRD